VDVLGFITSSRPHSVSTRRAPSPIPRLPRAS
jgi:hypothetical protein